MLEKIPPKKRGDGIHHEEWNALAQQTTRASRGTSNLTESGYRGASSQWDGPLTGGQLYSVYLSTDVLNPTVLPYGLDFQLYESLPYPWLFKCKIKTFDRKWQMWRLTDREWLLDAGPLCRHHCHYSEAGNVFDHPPIFQHDSLTAYWDESRGAFIPCSVPYPVRFAVLMSDMSPSQGQYGDMDDAIGHILVKDPAQFAESVDEEGVYTDIPWGTAGIYPFIYPTGRFRLVDSGIHVVINPSPLMPPDEVLRTGSWVAIAWAPFNSWIVVGSTYASITSCLPV